MGSATTTAQSVRDEVAELLGVDPAGLDPEADLIASGLDSIRMMSLSGRWRRQGIDVGFAALAANPTVAAWTELVAGRATTAIAGRDVTPEAAKPVDSDTFALAPIQHAMWVGRNDDQQLGGVAAHLYVEFDGAGVDPERLRDAAAKLALRHPMLRVEILPDGTQRIGDRGLPVTVYDLRDLDTPAAERRLEEIRQQKSHQMMHDEVLQFSLSLLAGGRTRLHVDMDMQAADAVSYRNFMADLAEFYSGATLPELNYTYREYRAALTSTTAASEEDRRWWVERIPELPEGPALPLVPRSEQADPKRTRRRWHIFDVATRDALFAAAHRRGITPAMAVAGSYAGTLARWATNRRFLLNLPMFGREQFHPDVDKLVGDFTSSLMLDVDLTAADTPAARCRVLQQTLHASARHSSYSGLAVLRDLTRHHGTPVLAPIVYTSALGLGDLFAGKVTEHFGSPVWTISQGPQVLLDAQATPVAEGLMINWDTREDAFRPGVADAMFAHHLAELQRLATDESAWDAVDVAAVTPEQQSARDAVLVTAAVSGEVLHDGFFRNAEARPDAPAVWSRAGNLSYGQLREQVLAVAAALRVAGIRPGDVVAVMGPKNFEQIVALLAISTVGAVYVPVGVDHPTGRASRMLANARVRMALVCGDDPPTTLPGLTVTEALRVGRRETGFRRPVVDPTDRAYILFTSGSTGEPKGVEMTHDASMNTIEFINGHFGINSADRCLALSSLECDLSVLDIFGTLGSGGSIVVVDEHERRDPDVWARLIAEHGVTVLHFMPGWLEMLSEVDGDLSSVRVVPTGGDWVRPELVRTLRTRAPHLRFAGLGGATETATHHTICEVIGDIPAEWTSIPLGVPLPNNVCRVVGPDGLDCPDWVPGELWVGGRGVARGYCARPDLTAQRFVHHQGRTWYRTGDLVRYRSGGLIEFVGRADHRIKISGYRVELGEVESALRRVAGVDSAVAAMVPADGGREVLAALISGDAGHPVPDPHKVTEAMAELVPPHMIPQILVSADQIPYTLGGKIDRAAVARQLGEADVRGGSGFRAPATALESALCAIIGTVLGRASVGADDDFFASGGDSVLATQVVARVRTWLDSPSVAVADIFAARSAAALAQRLIGYESDGNRLIEVAELYLEVADMDGAEVLSALDTGR